MSSTSIDSLEAGMRISSQAVSSAFDNDADVSTLSLADPQACPFLRPVDDAVATGRSSLRTSWNETSSPPMPCRRPLACKRLTSVSNETTPRAVCTDEHGEERMWHKQLTSTKVLLAVGTKDTCLKAIELLHKFIDDVRSQLVQSRPPPTQMPTGTLDGTNSCTTMIGNSVSECRSCAQCIVLLLRNSSTESIPWRRLDPNGVFARALDVCEGCSNLPMLRLPLLNSGALAQLVPLLMVDVKAAVESVVLTRPALRTVANLATLSDIQQNEATTALLTALPQLASEPSPNSIAELAAHALAVLSSHKGLHAGLLTAGAIPALVRACHAITSSHTLTEDAIIALGRIAEDGQFEQRVIEQGGIQALLCLIRLPGAPNSLVATAYESLAHLLYCAEGRRLLIEEGGVQV